jgi:hypothetical protein
MKDMGRLKKMKFVKYETKPDWIKPYKNPIEYAKGVHISESTPFDIMEDVCGLKLNIGIMKDIGLYIYYNTDRDVICCNICEALVGTRQYYNADDVILQGKLLEKNNYYGLPTKFLAENMFIDGVELTTLDMMYLLREYNIECLPILSLNHKVDINEIKEFKKKSMLANVEPHGIICKNRQKELSFLF